MWLLDLRPKLTHFELLSRKYVDFKVEQMFTVYLHGERYPIFHHDCHLEQDPSSSEPHFQTYKNEGAPIHLISLNDEIKFSCDSRVLPEHALLEYLKRI